LAVFFVCGIGFASFIDPFKYSLYPPAFGKIGFLVIATGLIFIFFAKIHALRSKNSNEDYIPYFRKGIYTKSRHPRLLGIFLVLIGLSLASGSVFAWIPALAFIPFCNRKIIPRFESELSRIFGDDFEKYKADVRPWI